MTMMKTARIHEYGDSSVIRYDAVPRPRPRPAFGEVLVQVAATSFNPTEAALRAGMLQAFFPVDLPYTLGWDLAGTVAEIGAGAEGFAVGDRVIGRLDSGVRLPSTSGRRPPRSSRRPRPSLSRMPRPFPWPG